MKSKHWYCNVSIQTVVHDLFHIGSFIVTDRLEHFWHDSLGGRGCKGVLLYSLQYERCKSDFAGSCLKDMSKLLKRCCRVVNSSLIWKDIFIDREHGFIPKWGYIWWGLANDDIQQLFLWLLLIFYQSFYLARKQGFTFNLKCCSPSEEDKNKPSSMQLLSVQLHTHSCVNLASL